MKPRCFLPSPGGGGIMAHLGRSQADRRGRLSIRKPLFKLFSLRPGNLFPVILGVALILAGSVDSEGARGPEKVQVRGVVVDEEGGSVPGVTVRLLKTRSLILPKKFALEDQVVEAGRAVTDASGMFEFEADRDSSYGGFFLRFYDPQTFDTVRFQVPEDREITRKWKQGRPIIVTKVLKPGPQWEEIVRRIDRYGKSSEVAEILRTLGLPDRVEGDFGDGREDWCYDRPGICYHLEGSQVLGQDRTLADTVVESEEG